MKTISLRSAARAVYHRVPEPLRAYILVKRRAPNWVQRGVIFVHIPKTAGVSVASTLYRNHHWHLSARRIQAFAPRLFNTLPSFSIVRNPWARCVSAYRFSLDGGEHVQRGNPDRFRSLPAFRSFEAFVEEWLPAQSIERVEGIFRPQVTYVTDTGGQVMVSHLGRVESLRETEAWLSELLGERIVFPVLNATIGSPVRYRDYYTPRLARLVGDIYRDDVTTFGYEF